MKLTQLENGVEYTIKALFRETLKEVTGTAVRRGNKMCIRLDNGPAFSTKFMNQFDLDMALSEAFQYVTVVCKKEERAEAEEPNYTEDEIDAFTAPYLANENTNLEGWGW